MFRQLFSKKFKYLFLPALFLFLLGAGLTNVSFAEGSSSTGSNNSWILTQFIPPDDDDGETTVYVGSVLSLKVNVNQYLCSIDFSPDEAVPTPNFAVHGNTNHHAMLCNMLLTAFSTGKKVELLREEEPIHPASSYYNLVAVRIFSE